MKLYPEGFVPSKQWWAAEQLNPEIGAAYLFIDSSKQRNHYYYLQLPDSVLALTPSLMSIVSGPAQSLFDLNPPGIQKIELAEFNRILQEMATKMGLSVELPSLQEQNPCP
ncbi:hypothetical protein [Larkinella soli]|uniref:hypothetical protein n=1 Tax=Larkinella soli TaxID=1770527 RepID=UPI000FFBC672|nr:hypothetical protein [Larkinella soli]